MKILRSSKEVEINNEEFLNRIENYSECVIDLGTGQGAFVYFNALENKDKFYIGLDSCGESMKKYGIKQYKNKIGNLMYIVMNAQNLDEILYNKFSEIYINLPWGSLLQGVFKEELKIIEGISKLSKPKCKISICLSYDEKFEKSEIEKRNLPRLNENYFKDVFIPIYNRYGIEIKSIEYISKEGLSFQSKWMRVLTESRSRKFYIITCEKK